MGAKSLEKFRHRSADGLNFCECVGHPVNSTPVAPTLSPTLAQRLRRLWPYFEGTKQGIVLAFVGALIAAATEPAIPALLKALLDEGFNDQQFPLWMVPVALVGLFAIRGLATFLAKYALSYTANGAMIALRAALFERLLKADARLFSEQSASKLSNTLVYEVQTGTTMLVNSLLTLVRDALTLVALMAYLLFLNWQLTLIVLAMFPPLAWIMKTLSKRVYRIARTSQEATDELAYVVEENVLANRMVRLHGAQAQQSQRFDRLSRVLRNLSMKSTIAGAAMTPLAQMLAALALSIVISVALWQNATTGVSVGSFVGFVTAMLMLITPIRQLADLANPITRGLAALERGMALLDEIPEQTDGHHQATRSSGHLSIEQLSVTYPGQSEPSVHEVSLTLVPGQITALVGPSGSGKTTLANTLPRFVDYTAGDIRLDGVSITDWTLASLRSQFAMVSQDVVMFNDTLAANVALGSELDAQRVLQALRLANLGDLVDRLPEGIHSPVGHNATQLSGGQRQRLAIARAIYKDAPILILDEATSALDTESERLVQDALARLMQGRTTLVIAHRLSTIEHADRVVVLVHGRIVEQGTHHELLAAHGVYARLHAQSQGGVLGE